MESVVPRWTVDTVWYVAVSCCRNLLHPGAMFEERGAIHEHRWQCHMYKCKPTGCSIVPRYPSGVLGPARTDSVAYSLCSGTMLLGRTLCVHSAPR